MTECRLGSRGPALVLHFGEGDAWTVAAAQRHLEGCAACREYRAELAALQETLGAWVDEPPPAHLRESVLARAPGAAQEPPEPARPPHALPLLALLPVMAAGAAAIRFVATWLSALPYAPKLDELAVLSLLGPTGTAILLILALGAFATLALAPALFLEIRDHDHPSRRTLGLHG